MTRCPQAPGIVLLAIAVPAAAFPAGAAAQTGAEPYGHTLRAAVSKALESPFHASSGTDSPVALAMPGPGPAPAPKAPYRSSDSLPSFGRVFLPVIAATYLTDLLAGVVLIYMVLDDRDIDRTKEVALILTVPVVVPALVAGGITGRYGYALLGSAFGTALALAGARSGSAPVALALPAIHAALTTLLAWNAEQ